MDECMIISLISEGLGSVHRKVKHRTEWWATKRDAKVKLQGPQRHRYVILNIMSCHRPQQPNRRDRRNFFYYGLHYHHLVGYTIQRISTCDDPWASYRNMLEC